MCTYTCEIVKNGRGLVEEVEFQAEDVFIGEMLWLKNK